MMSSPCENCDRMQDMPPGNASVRPEFHQPTMYDHLDSFSKYKEAKQLAKKLKATKEELLKFNQKFTDLQLDSKEEEVLEKFSTQDIAKFRCSLKEGRFHCRPETVEPEDLWKKQYEVKPAASLTTISRTPVSCPVSKCGRTIGVTSVLSHFLRDHNEELGVESHNLYAGGRSILLFDRNMFDFGENVCLGVLPYGGIEGQEESRPAIRGICKQNSFLSKSYAHLENHLPILVMVCKTSICAMIDDKKLFEQLMDPENKAKHVLVIWLVTVQTTKPIYCTITAFDEAMTSSRSTIIHVRSLESPQSPNEFLSSDTNYLMLNQGELDILSEQGAKSVHVEIKIHEFDEFE